MARVTLRLSEDLHRRLRSASERVGAPLNQLIIAAVSEALTRTEGAEESGNSLREQLQQVRLALSDVTVELDPRQAPPHLRPSEDLPDTDTLTQSMPELIPPLSATVSAGRKDRL
ncbi:MAG: hypothetical protein GEU73_13690 [Chloroflexi bacterium]|nr:hypothetical protein [Chloroflexota bacterium]